MTCFFIRAGLLCVKEGFVPDRTGIGLITAEKRMAGGVFEFRARGRRRVLHPETCGVSLSNGDSMRLGNFPRKRCTKIKNGFVTPGCNEPSSSEIQCVMLKGCPAHTRRNAGWPDQRVSACSSERVRPSRILSVACVPLPRKSAMSLPYPYPLPVGYCGRSKTVPSSVTSARPAENLTSTRNRRRALAVGPFE